MFYYLITFFNYLLIKKILIKIISKIISFYYIYLTLFFIFYFNYSIKIYTFKVIFLGLLKDILINKLFKL